MRPPKYGIALFALLLLVLFAATHWQKNAPAVACPSCPGNMRSSADGMSCVPKMCDKGDTGCPDVSIGCPTLVEAAAGTSCESCPAGWRPSGSSCVSTESMQAMPCLKR